MSGTMLKVRKIEYPTPRANVLDPIQGYRVQFTGGEYAGGDWSVFRYVGARSRVCDGGRGLSEDAAHTLAAGLAGTVPHPVTYA